ncbi:MAG: hypothetical protein OHK0023_20660 [Anaerolineae bacterium]
MKQPSASMNSAYSDTVQVDVATLLHAALAHSSLLLCGRPIRLIADIDAALPSVSGPILTLLDIGVRYLLHCAIHTTQQGSITLSAKRDRSSLLVAVMDTGTGTIQLRQEAVIAPAGSPEATLRHLQATLESYRGKLWSEVELGAGSSYFIRVPLHHAISTSQSPSTV